MSDLCPGMCVIEGGLEGESKYTRVQPLSIKDHGLMLPNLQFQGLQLHFLAECLPLKENCVPLATCTCTFLPMATLDHLGLQGRGFPDLQSQGLGGTVCPRKA